MPIFPQLTLSPCGSLDVSVGTESTALALKGAQHVHDSHGWGSTVGVHECSGVSLWETHEQTWTY